MTESASAPEQNASSRGSIGGGSGGGPFAGVGTTKSVASSGEGSLSRSWCRIKGVTSDGEGLVGGETENQSELRRSLCSQEKRCPSGETAVHWRQNPHNNSQKQDCRRKNPLFLCVLTLVPSATAGTDSSSCGLCHDIQHFRFAFLLRSGLLGAVNVARPIPLIAWR